MGFALIAELPLGIYRGHVGSSNIDTFPSVARLHAALLCAAATGPRAEIDNNHLTPNPTDKEALEWLENNPPDGISLPNFIKKLFPGIAYREIGLLEKRQKMGYIIQKPMKPATFSIAVDGPIAWVWDNPPSDEVRDSLAELCSDVSHLGMAETPVRLRVSVEDAQPTHQRDDKANLFIGSGWDFDVPIKGRTEELIQQEIEVRYKELPTIPEDQVKTKEKEISAPPWRKALRVVRYRSVEPEPLVSPWSTVFLVPIDQDIDLDWRVRWAVAMHRALISLVGNDAPAILSGVYPTDATKPANRVAIHFLEAEVLPSYIKEKLGDTVQAVMAVLVPSNATTSDVEVIAQAVNKLQFLRGPGKQFARRTDKKTLVFDASHFWSPVAMGYERHWFTIPASVPDGRPPRRREWSMADAVALSIGLVWRDSLIEPGHGVSWQVALANKVKEHGVSVNRLSMVTDGDLTRFVHRVNPGVVVRPYRALLNLGQLAHPQALVAIGQSRHLGGGLLYPIDIASNQQEVVS
jgi:CRISPR-associated protein Csb2